LDAITKNGVRQSGSIVRDVGISDTAIGSPAHLSNRLIAQLNENWRVLDDPLQWILQRRKGNPRKRNSGWQNRSFCRTREGLLRCVRENCSEVDQDALTQLQVLPKYHPDWEQAR
jgi:hypothetical protein